MKHKILILTGFVLVVILVALMALPLQARPRLGVTNFDSIHLSDTGGTATPVLRVNSDGPSNIVEFLDAGTPVFTINDGGGIVASSILTQGATINNLIVTQPTAQTTATPAAVINSLAAGSKILDVQDASTPVFSVLNGGAWSSTGAGTHSSGQTINNWAKVAAPTAIATATPAMVVDSAGVSNILEVRDAATPVFAVNNGGAWSSTGAGTHSSGQTINNWAKVAAPTAIATATPAMVVDSAGVSTILEVRDAATPVFTVNNGGSISGQVMTYASAGSEIVCGTTSTFTETTNVTATGLTAAVYVIANQITDAASTAAFITVSDPTTTTFTISSWETDATAGTTGITAHWCAIGTQ